MGKKGGGIQKGGKGRGENGEGKVLQRVNAQISALLPRVRSDSVPMPKSMPCCGGALRMRGLLFSGIWCS